MARCEPILKRLKDEQNVTVQMQQFSLDVADYDPKGSATGKRSEYGRMLSTMRERFGNDTNILAVVMVGDGADNGGTPAREEATRWRGLAPVECFLVGQDTTTQDQRDVALSGITSDPSPVFVKGKLTLKVAADAAGFEGKPVVMRVYFDDQEVVIQKSYVNDKEVVDGRPQFPLTKGNEIRLEVNAPPIPREVRVTVKVEPLAGEVVIGNNEIATYVSVVKEGVSILYVDRLRPERKFIRAALASDPRFRLFEVIRQTDAPPAGAEGDLFELDRQTYDVIIVGDVSARAIKAGGPRVLEQIRTLVRDKGAGFVMLGGDYTFAGTRGVPESGGWASTPIGDLLPVELAAPGHHAGPLEFHPTPKGDRHFMMQLGSSAEESRQAWKQLNDKQKLLGANQVARAKGAIADKPAAEVLATSGPGGAGDVLLVGQQFGKGRTLACAVDTTHRWRELGLPDKTDGIEFHARFWKQVVLWLAQQETTEGNVWLTVDTRRLQSGARQTFSAGIRGKNGLDLPGGTLSAKVTAPDGTESPVPLSRDGKVDRGLFNRSLMPGEYVVHVTGKGVDTDGKAIEGKASVRYLVYQDETEMLRPAADSQFMSAIAQAGGGRANPYRLEELPTFLQDLLTRSAAQPQSKTRQWPEWRKTTLTPFLPLWLILFVALLGTEWGLRRYWGMV
jgi:uncharacterized membrane protein